MLKSKLLRKPSDAGKVVFHLASDSFDGSSCHAEQLVWSGSVTVDRELGSVLDKFEDAGGKTDDVKRFLCFLCFLCLLCTHLSGHDYIFVGMVYDLKHFPCNSC